MTQPETIPTCTARVHDGGRSVSSHSCGNKAREGTEPPRCGVHLPKAKADPRPAPTAASAQVTERLTVSLSWPEEQGPRFEPQYTSRLVEVARLSMTLDRGDRPGNRVARIAGSGYAVNKDGSLGQGRRVDLRYLDWDSLPVEIREEFLNALDEHEAKS